ncbi:glycosyltransferase family 2 protein [Duganella sp. P38]|uniref:glycosyltransferase family 2 protein n=1 Tax=Duganella sp. P38 TaxID=3423949 RepID=UPI003D7ACD77
MRSVTICIASIGRESLLQTLRSLQQNDLSTVNLDIIIADDSGKDAVVQLIAGEKWSLSIQVVTAGGRNVALARNRCLEAARGDYLAFIDDDELAAPDWLANLVRLAEERGADAVFGPVDAIFPANTPEWMRRAGPFIKRPGARGAAVTTGSTCNALVRHDFVRKHGLHFREQFGRSGGEDTDFFARMSALGALMLASDDAFLSEHVPAERLRLADLRRRYTRGGQTYAGIMLEGRAAAARLRFYGSALVRLGVSALVVAGGMLLNRRDVAMRYGFKVWLNVGKLRHGCGLPLFDYY